jgi:predicted nucleic acid-binding protein
VNFLLDTNVVSELRRRRPNPNVLSWLEGVDPTSLHVSVLTLGEIAKGAAMCAAHDPARATVFYQWLESVRLRYADRVLGIDEAIAERWGHLAAKRALPVIDGLLAATALVRGMTLVTRDTRDTAGTGVAWLDPFNP